MTLRDTLHCFTLNEAGLADQISKGLRKDWQIFGSSAERTVLTLWTFQLKDEALYDLSGISDNGDQIIQSKLAVFKPDLSDSMNNMVLQRIP